MVASTHSRSDPWEDLAHELDLNVGWTGSSYVLYGDRKCVHLGLVTVREEGWGRLLGGLQECVVTLLFNGGVDRARLWRSIMRDQEFLQAWDGFVALDAPGDCLSVGHDRVDLRVGLYGCFNEHHVKPLAVLVEALVRAASKRIGILVPLCCCCGAGAARLAFTDSRVVPLCPACIGRSETGEPAHTRHKNGRRSTGSTADDTGHELRSPNYLVIDPQRLDAGAHRLRRRLECAPRLFAVQTVGLGALGLLMGLVICALPLGFALAAFRVHLLLGVIVSAIVLAGGLTLWMRDRLRTGQGALAGDDDPSVTFTRVSAPRLFSWLDEIGSIVCSRTPTQVRLRLLGSPHVDLENRGHGATLVLSVPFLLTMSLEEFRAIVAHELAHCRTPPSRLLRWLRFCLAGWCKVTRMWPSWVRPLRQEVVDFTQWWIPAVMMRVWLTSRLEEEAADRASVTACGCVAAGSALACSPLASTLADEALSRVLTRWADESHGLPQDLLNRWARAIDGIPRRRRIEALRRELDDRTGWMDSHPSLRERLASVGVDGTLDACAPEILERRCHRGVENSTMRTSAFSLLEDFPETWAALVEGNRAWMEESVSQVAASRRVVRNGIRAMRKALRKHPGSLVLQTVLALRCDELGKTRAAYRLLKGVTRKDPRHLDAHFALGRVLASRGAWRKAAPCLKPVLRRAGHVMSNEDLAWCADVFARARRHRLAARVLRSVLERRLPPLIRGRLTEKLQLLEESRSRGI